MLAWTSMIILAGRVDEPGRQCASRMMKSDKPLASGLLPTSRNNACLAPKNAFALQQPHSGFTRNVQLAAAKTLRMKPKCTD